MTRELEGRRQDREEGKDSKDVEDLVCAHTLLAQNIIRYLATLQAPRALQQPASCYVSDLWLRQSCYLCYSKADPSAIRSRCNFTILKIYINR